MPKLQNKIICVFGKRGSGKSYLTQNVILPNLGGRIIIFDTLHEYEGGEIVNDFPSLFDYLEFEKRLIIFRTDRDDYFEHLCRVIYESQQNTWLVVDELDMYTSATIGDMPEYFRKIIRYGRHKGIGVVGISRRPAALPREVTSQSTYIISFQQHEPRDIKYLTEFVPVEPEKFSNLPRFEYLSYNTDTGKISGTFPE